MRREIFLISTIFSLLLSCSSDDDVSQLDVAYDLIVQNDPWVLDSVELHNIDSGSYELSSSEIENHIEYLKSVYFSSLHFNGDGNRGSADSTDETRSTGDYYSLGFCAGNCPILWGLIDETTVHWSYINVIHTLILSRINEAPELIWKFENFSWDFEKPDGTFITITYDYHLIYK